MVTNLFGDGNGARNREENVPRVGIVMTDGQSGDSVLEHANNARAEGITLFAIGIGSGIDESELRQIANDPDDTFVFQVNDFDVIENIRSLVSQEACEGMLNNKNHWPYFFVRLFVFDCMFLLLLFVCFFVFVSFCCCCCCYCCCCWFV